MSTKCSPISQEGCWELLVEEAENEHDTNLGQQATAKNVARLDRSWYTIQADLRHFSGAPARAQRSTMGKKIR